MILAHRAPSPRIALFAIPLSEALLEDFHGAPSPWVLPFAFLADLGYPIGLASTRPAPAQAQAQALAPPQAPVPGRNPSLTRVRLQPRSDARPGLAPALDRVGEARGAPPTHLNPPPSPTPKIN